MNSAEKATSTRPSKQALEKIVNDSRSPCVICNVLEVLGDKWSLLVVRDLFLFDKHEFKEFLASPEAIATNILTDRLRKLSGAGIIAEVAHPANRSRKLYYLTERGKDLLPLLLEMAVWGEKHLAGMEEMQALFAKLKADADGFKTEILVRMQEWERTWLSQQ